MIDKRYYGRRALTVTTFLFFSILLTGSAWAAAADCTGITVDTTCDADSECWWKTEFDMCVPKCIDYDGSDQATCEAAFGGGYCIHQPQYDPDECWYINFTQAGFGCNETVSSTCDAKPNCTWDEFGPGGGHCIVDCFQFDSYSGGNNDTCTNAYGGSVCVWKPDPYMPDQGICDPFFFEKGFDGGSPCFMNEGNKTACDAMGDECSWFSEPNCQSWEPCYDKNAGGTDHGWCDPTGKFDFGMDYQCWLYEGNKTGCEKAKNDLLWPCEWFPDPFAFNDKTGNGSGWCDMTFMGGAGGCWDFFDNESCSGASDTMGCTWDTNAPVPFCRDQGCWDFDNNETGCNWLNSTLDFKNCYYENISGGPEGFCYEEFVEFNCSTYDNREFDCYDTKWCFWEYSTQTCQAPMMTGPGGGGGFGGPIYNPQCFIFAQAGEAKCEQVWSCDWSGGACVDNSNMTDFGVQCSDINNSNFCNSIPMLSTCCKWNTTDSNNTCADAPYTTSCWDNMQEPPEGAFFCEDYKATSNQTLCEQIANDPWYMPCEWDTPKAKCKFTFDDMIAMMGPPPGGGGGFGFKDIDTPSMCNATGGIWKEEFYFDPITGATLTDTWCEKTFGFSKEVCNKSCYACEYQDNGSGWSSGEDFKNACQNSPAGCSYINDTLYSFNGFGWCDMDWGKAGNCDYNCWECWDQSQCSGSNAGCNWNPIFGGFCEDSNIKTCADDCYLCWDQGQCDSSAAGCYWEPDYWYCSPENKSKGGDSEICFNGVDDDGDSFIDCGDSGCMFDPFCGGGIIFEGVDCFSKTDPPSCTNTNVSATNNCTWINDTWGNAWCDYPGAECWLYDDNATACNDAAVTNGNCNYTVMSDIGKSNSFCDVNFTVVDNLQCWDKDNTSCGLDGDGINCTWVKDPWCSSSQSSGDPNCANFNANLNQSEFGWCEPTIFTCWQYDNNETGCTQAPRDEYCDWYPDPFSPTGTTFGLCDPICFGREAGTCETQVLGADYCTSLSADNYGWCQSNVTSTTFMGCWDYFSEGDCNAKSDTCVWIKDPVFGYGFCSDKFMFDVIGDMDPSPPMDIAWDDYTDNENASSDIKLLGIKDDPESIGIGVGVTSMANSSLCGKKFPEYDSSLNRTTKFYIYVDANGNTTDGCPADDNSSITGFDFKFKYEAKIDNGSLIENKVAYKCLNATWSASKIKLSTWPDQTCYLLDGGIVAISKDDLTAFEALGLYNKTKIMRIYATTATVNDSAASPYDTIGPALYKPGTADFKPEDCGNELTDNDADGLLPADDPDCYLYNSFGGYVEAEQGYECEDNKDNDLNGYTDCDDPSCWYDTAYCTPPSLENDTTAPSVSTMEVNVLPDGAFISLVTDEPTNATVMLYKNDTRCVNASNASMVLDLKLNNSFDFDDYDVWHDTTVDDSYFDRPGTDDYDFNAGTTYFYKTKVCDRSSLCAQSACLNFTTLSEEQNFSVGFDLPPPGADSTALMGFTQAEYDWGADGTYDDNQTGDRDRPGANSSKGKNVNIKFSNPNATNQWGIEFMGASFKDRADIDVSGALIVNETSDNSNFLVGMKKSNWSKIAQTLGVDYVKVKIPKGSSDFDSGTSKVYHCPDWFTTINSSCAEVNLTQVNCTIGTSETTCEVPTNIGFSVYGVSGTTSGGGGGPGGGGGGGAADPKITVATEEGKVEVKIDFLPANKETAVTIPSTENMPFASLGINVNKKVTDIEMNITTLDEKPADISADISGKVSDYIQIDTKNIEETDINNVTNAFKVLLSWIEDNGIDKDNVVLNRYADGAWNALTTTKSSEDSDYVYYSAVSPGLSVFGISGQVEGEVPPPMTTVAPTTAPATTAPPTAPVTTAPPKKKKFFGICGPSAVLLIMVLPPFVYGLRRKRR